MTVRPLTPELAERYETGITNGMIVLSVDDSSVAAGRGIQAGDVITAIDHHEVRSLKEFKDAAKKADLKKGVSLNLSSHHSARVETLKQPQAD